MATNYPGALDVLTNPTASTKQDDLSHAGQHTDVNDAVEALQAKVGIDNSANTASLDYRVKQAELLPAKLAATTPGAGTEMVGFKNVAAGSIARTLAAKMAELEVTPEDFGAVGDGVTNDAVALTAFFNSANTRPNVVHKMAKKIYLTNVALPQITNSNVIIIGYGFSIKDSGAPVTGTVIKYAGAGGYTTPIVRIAPIAGASNRRVDHVVFSGICIDCNNGIAQYGIKCDSLFDCEIKIGVMNAALIGCQFGVVATLADVMDLQRCDINIVSRQYEAGNGVGIVCTGSNVANVSYNDFVVDAQHVNQPAIRLLDADNNTWFVRAFCIGTATASVECHGNNSGFGGARSERFTHLGTSKPLYAYGTPTYTTPAYSIRVDNIDRENGTPNPIVEAGASVAWQLDSDRLPSTPAQTWTPVVAASSGSITSYTSSGSYIDRGRMRHFKIQVNVTNNGTGAGNMTISMPGLGSGPIGVVCAGIERSGTPKQLVCFLDGFSNSLAVFRYDGVYPAATGASITIAGWCEIG